MKSQLHSKRNAPRTKDQWTQRLPKRCELRHTSRLNHYAKYGKLWNRTHGATQGEQQCFQSSSKNRERFESCKQPLRRRVIQTLYSSMCKKTFGWKSISWWWHGNDGARLRTRQSITPDTIWNGLTTLTSIGSTTRGYMHIGCSTLTRSQIKDCSEKKANDVTISSIWNIKTHLHQHCRTTTSNKKGHQHDLDTMDPEEQSTSANITANCSKK